MPSVFEQLDAACRLSRESGLTLYVWRDPGDLRTVRTERFPPPDDVSRYWLCQDGQPTYVPTCNLGFRTNAPLS
jgi:hypothetical protein